MLDSSARHTNISKHVNKLLQKQNITVISLILAVNLTGDSFKAFYSNLTFQVANESSRMCLYFQSRRMRRGSDLRQVYKSVSRAFQRASHGM